MQDEERNVLALLLLALLVFGITALLLPAGGANPAGGGGGPGNAGGGVNVLPPNRCELSPPKATVPKGSGQAFGIACFRDNVQEADCGNVKWSPRGQLTVMAESAQGATVRMDSDNGQASLAADTPVGTCQAQIAAAPAVGGGLPADRCEIAAAGKVRGGQGFTQLYSLTCYKDSVQEADCGNAQWSVQGPAFIANQDSRGAAVYIQSRTGTATVSAATPVGGCSIVLDSGTARPGFFSDICLTDPAACGAGNNVGGLDLCVAFPDLCAGGGGAAGGDICLLNPELCVPQEQPNPPPAGGAQGQACNQCEDLGSLNESMMFVSEIPDTAYDLTLVYKFMQNGFQKRNPVRYSPVVMYIQQKEPPKKQYIFVLYTNENGKAEFEFSKPGNGWTPPTPDGGCYEYRFAYCQSVGPSCAFRQCMAGIGVDLSKLPANEQSVDGMPLAPGTAKPAQPADPLVGKVQPTSATITYCPPPPPIDQAAPPFCLPLALIFAFLAGALYLTGRNPLGAFDLSTPRMHKPYQYAARGTGVTFSIQSVISAAMTVTGAIKDAKKARAEAKARADKEHKKLSAAELRKVGAQAVFGKYAGAPESAEDRLRKAERKAVDDTRRQIQKSRMVLTHQERSKRIEEAKARARIEVARQLGRERGLGKAEIDRLGDPLAKMTLAERWNLRMGGHLKAMGYRGGTTGGMLIGGILRGGTGGAVGEALPETRFPSKEEEAKMSPEQLKELGNLKWLAFKEGFLEALGRAFPWLAVWFNPRFRDQNFGVKLLLTVTNIMKRSSFGMVFSLLNEMLTLSSRIDIALGGKDLIDYVFFYAWKDLKDSIQRWEEAKKTVSVVETEFGRFVLMFDPGGKLVGRGEGTVKVNGREFRVQFSDGRFQVIGPDGKAMEDGAKKPAAVGKAIQRMSEELAKGYREVLRKANESYNAKEAELKARQQAEVGSATNMLAFLSEKDVRKAMLERVEELKKGEGGGAKEALDDYSILLRPPKDWGGQLQKIDRKEREAVAELGKKATPEKVAAVHARYDAERQEVYAERQQWVEAAGAALGRLMRNPRESGVFGERVLGSGNGQAFAAAVGAISKQLAELRAKRMVLAAEAIESQQKLAVASSEDAAWQKQEEDHRKRMGELMARIGPTAQGAPPSATHRFFEAQADAMRERAGLLGKATGEGASAIDQLLALADLAAKDPAIGPELGRLLGKGTMKAVEEFAARVKQAGGRAGSRLENQAAALVARVDEKAGRYLQKEAATERAALAKLEFVLAPTAPLPPRYEEQFKGVERERQAKIEEANGLLGVYEMAAGTRAASGGERIKSIAKLARDPVLGAELERTLGTETVRQIAELGAQIERGAKLEPALADRINGALRQVDEKAGGYLKQQAAEAKETQAMLVAQINSDFDARLQTLRLGAKVETLGEVMNQARLKAEWDGALAGNAALRQEAGEAFMAKAMGWREAARKVIGAQGELALEQAKLEREAHELTTEELRLRRERNQVAGRDAEEAAKDALKPEKLERYKLLALDSNDPMARAYAVLGDPNADAPAVLRALAEAYGSIQGIDLQKVRSLVEKAQPKESAAGTPMVSPKQAERALRELEAMVGANLADRLVHDPELAYRALGSRSGEDFAAVLFEAAFGQANGERLAASFRRQAEDDRIAKAEAAHRNTVAALWNGLRDSENPEVRQAAETFELIKARKAAVLEEARANGASRDDLAAIAADYDRHIEEARYALLKIGIDAAVASPADIRRIVLGTATDPVPPRYFETEFRQGMAEATERKDRAAQRDYAILLDPTVSMEEREKALARRLEDPASPLRLGEMLTAARVRKLESEGTEIGKQRQEFESASLALPLSDAGARLREAGSQEAAAYFADRLKQAPTDTETQRAYRVLANAQSGTGEKAEALRVLFQDAGEREAIARTFGEAFVHALETYFGESRYFADKSHDAAVQGKSEPIQRAYRVLERPDSRPEEREAALRTIREDSDERAALGDRFGTGMLEKLDAHFEALDGLDRKSDELQRRKEELTTQQAGLDKQKEAYDQQAAQFRAQVTALAETLKSAEVAGWFNDHKSMIPPRLAGAYDILCSRDPGIGDAQRLDAFNTVINDPDQGPELRRLFQAGMGSEEGLRRRVGGMLAEEARQLNDQTMRLEGNRRDAQDRRAGLDLQQAAAAEGQRSVEGTLDQMTGLLLELGKALAAEKEEAGAGGGAGAAPLREYFAQRAFTATDPELKDSLRALAAGEPTGEAKMALDAFDREHRLAIEKAWKDEKTAGLVPQMEREYAEERNRLLLGFMVKALAAVTANPEEMAALHQAAAGMPEIRIFEGEVIRAGQAVSEMRMGQTGQEAGKARSERTALDGFADALGSIDRIAAQAEKKGGELDVGALNAAFARAQQAAEENAALRGGVQAESRRFSEGFRPVEELPQTPETARAAGRMYDRLAGAQADLALSCEVSAYRASRELEERQNAYRERMEAQMEAVTESPELKGKARAAAAAVDTFEPAMERPAKLDRLDQEEEAALARLGPDASEEKREAVREEYGQKRREVEFEIQADQLLRFNSAVMKDAAAAAAIKGLLGDRLYAQFEQMARRMDELKGAEDPLVYRELRERMEPELKETADAVAKRLKEADAQMRLGELRDFAVLGKSAAEVQAMAEKVYRGEMTTEELWRQVPGLGPGTDIRGLQENAVNRLLGNADTWAELVRATGAASTERLNELRTEKARIGYEQAAVEMQFKSLENATRMQQVLADASERMKDGTTDPALLKVAERAAATTGDFVAAQAAAGGQRLVSRIWAEEGYALQQAPPAIHEPLAMLYFMEKTKEYEKRMGEAEDGPTKARRQEVLEAYQTLSGAGGEDDRRVEALARVLRGDPASRLELREMLGPEVYRTLENATNAPTTQVGTLNEILQNEAARMQAGVDAVDLEARLYRAGMGKEVESVDAMARRARVERGADAHTQREIAGLNELLEVAERNGTTAQVRPFAEEYIHGRARAQDQPASEEHVAFLYAAQAAAQRAAYTAPGATQAQKEAEQEARAASATRLNELTDALGAYQNPKSSAAMRERAVETMMMSQEEAEERYRRQKAGREEKGK